MFRIYEKTLTDGSKVYGLILEDQWLDAVDELAALKLADEIEAATNLERRPGYYHQIRD